MKEWQKKLLNKLNESIAEIRDFGKPKKGQPTFAINIPMPKIKPAKKKKRVSFTKHSEIIVKLEEEND